MLNDASREILKTALHQVNEEVALWKKEAEWHHGLWVNATNHLEQALNKQVQLKESIEVR